MDRPQLAKDIMVTRLVTLTPDTQVFAGIARLLKNRVSGAPVVADRRRYLGVFSEKCCLRVLSNSARFANAKSGRVPVTAASVMSTNLVTLSPDMDVFEAIGYLLKHKISGAPVVNANRELVGSFSEKTSMSVLIQSAYAQMPTSTVKEFMQGLENRTISHQLDLNSIAAIFLNTPYRRLQVLRDGKLVGQVSRRDVLWAEQRLAKSSLAPDELLQSWRDPHEEDPAADAAPSSNGHGSITANAAKLAAYVDSQARTISSDTDLLSIAQIFLDSPYRRLPVVEDGELMGQVSRRDLLAATNNMMEIAPPKEKSLLYLSSLVDRQESPIE